jgi:hypothetical protein
MRAVRPATAAVATAVAVLTSCGDEEPVDPRSEPDPVIIEITVQDGTVEPSGERVDVAVGQPVELVVTADTSGSIHVHTEPEHQLEYGEGTTTLPLTIDTPGVVDVEAHDPAQVIVQLEVE